MDEDAPIHLSRRELLSLGGGILAATGVAPLVAFPANSVTTAPAPLAEQRYVTAVEGTNIAAAVSPDGRQLAFDLYGILWLVPVEGGPARRLTQDLFDIGQPDWSPDGRRLVFESYRDGNFHLWSIGADGTGIRQLTRGPFDCREPCFSPDGKRVAFSSDRNGRYGIHILDLDSGAIRAFSDGPGEQFGPSWSPDGGSIAFSVDQLRIDVVDDAGRRRTIARLEESRDTWTVNSLSSPVFTTDGRDVLYVAIEKGRAELRGSTGPLIVGDDVFPFRVSWLSPHEVVYTGGGKIKRWTVGGGEPEIIEFSAVVPVATPRYLRKVRDFNSSKPRPVVGIGSPTLSPDGKSIAFRALNDLWVMPLGGLPRPLTRDSFCKLDPAWSPDGRVLAYSTDKGGDLDIWLRDLQTDQDRQLTRFKDAAVSSAWSRDGQSIAFLNQKGALHVVNVASGDIRKIYGELWEPGKPTWSRDGRTIAVAAFKPYSARFREGLSEILTVDVDTGKGNYQPILPHRSIGTRGDDGPVWSPDGKFMAFVFGSRLWIAPVDAVGKLTGAPRPTNDEVTDAISWSGDSSQLLYLSAGKLRIIAATGGAPRTVALNMTWASAKPKGRMVVHAGRLWDGFGPEIRENVDIVVESNRVVAVVPHGNAAGDASARRIDASRNTVIPGLIDMHVHRQMQGYAYGDREGRLWLSMGITTTRSPGGPAYHSVEDQEAIESGARIGPRYYVTGEALDGSRIYYNFMRPVTEPGQMTLELQRAQALSYDLIKTYVRLSPERQREVMEWAHARGLHVTSHYHYPALAFGLDGMEHMGATARTGYSRTQSALGASYQDVTAVFVHSQASRTPTLFNAKILLAKDRSFLNDRRVRALYPPWEIDRLKERTELMSTIDEAPLLAALGRNVAEIKRTIRAGGRIVTGTDSPIDFNAISLHMNLRAMVRCGLTPYEALLTTTRASGEFLGAPLGSIQAGAYADFVIIDGDPLTRIEDAANVLQVVKNGELYTIDDLVKPFEGRADMTAMAPQPQPLARETAAEYWWHDPVYLEHASSSCCDSSTAIRADRSYTRRRIER